LFDAGFDAVKKHRRKVWVPKLEQHGIKYVSAGPLSRSPSSVGGGSKKIADNPMDQDLELRLKNLQSALRCGALTRAGAACQRPAMRGRRRCRLHGGLSPGAPRGAENGNFRNGNWTAEAIEERRWLRSLVQAFATMG